jgi:NAD(P)-dependent dehydrogenase (short-subunit alcohol dehydrogenase family)
MTATGTTNPARRWPARLLVAGGSSGIGLGLARAALAEGAEVTIAGRSRERLDAAAARLGAPERLRTEVADIASEPDVRRLFAGVGTLDHIATTAADIAGATGPIADLDVDAARRVVDSKLLGPCLLAKHGAPRLDPGGSITFTSGIAAYRPGPSGAMVAAANGALASLASALAVQLAPVRVNVVSPGWVDTPVWDLLAGPGKAAALRAMAERLPVGRVGTPEDVAQAFLAVMRNPFVTATVLHVDGGQRLV